MRLAKSLRAAGRLLAAAALLGLGVSPARADVQAPARAATQTERTVKPALWLVRDRDTKIYLFGTIHVLAPGLKWFVGPVAEAFDASQTLVTEIGNVGGPGQEQGLAGAKDLLRKAMLPKGESLRDKLEPQDRAALEAALTKVGMPVAAVDRLKPWYAALVLSSLPLLKAGYRLDQGVEMQLAKRAREGGKTQEALESAVAQVGMFQDLPEASQLAYLRKVLADVDKIGKETAAIVEDWSEGDAEGLANAINAETSDPALMETLVVKRNRAWADWVQSRLEQPGTVFVAVGAGHLAGPLSLQNELAKRGLKSRRVQ